MNKSHRLQKFSPNSTPKNSIALQQEESEEKKLRK